MPRANQYFFRPGGPNHEQEDKHVNQGGAGVAGDDEDKAAEVGQHSHQFGHRWDRTQLFGVLKLGQQLGQQHGVEELYNFRRLNVEGNAGNVEPGPVAQDLGTKGGAQQQQKKSTSQYHPPPLVHQQMDVELGDHKVQADADEHGHSLLQGEGVKGHFPAGGGVDECDAV